MAAAAETMTTTTTTTTGPWQTHDAQAQTEESCSSSSFAFSCTYPAESIAAAVAISGPHTLRPVVPPPAGTGLGVVDLGSMNVGMGLGIVGSGMGSGDHALWQARSGFVQLEEGDGYVYRDGDGDGEEG